jgi:hypothetical protein
VGQAARAIRAAGRTDSPLCRGFAHLDRAHSLLTTAPDGAAQAAALASRWFARKGHLPGVRRCAELVSPAAHVEKEPS